ncbi:MAG: LacI family DNA-binding transcriptional regulator [Limnochordia bacterium]|jgi:LacI family transcriptional regulator
MKVTMRDVAREAGVAVSTVSLVVNNREGVSDELRAKVLKAVEKLGYRPNRIARSLKTDKSHVLGLIIPDITNPFFPLLVRGVTDTASTYGYSILLANSDGKVEEERKYLNVFADTKVDGIIFTTSVKFKDNLQLLQELPIPKVVLDRYLGPFNIPTVTADNITGGYLAVKHLLECGSRRILIISGPQGYPSSMDRLTGYKRALDEHGIAVDPDLIEYGDFTLAGGQKAISAVLDRGLDFDGVFAANDLMALGVLVELAAREIPVPEKVQVVGYDDIPSANLFQPALTTIRQPAYEIGHEAVRTLIRAIHHRDRTPPAKILVPELIVRKSTRAAE